MARDDLVGIGAVIAECHVCASTSEFYCDCATDVAATAEDDGKFILKIGHVVLFLILECG